MRELPDTLQQKINAEAEKRIAQRKRALAEEYRRMAAQDINAYAQHKLQHMREQFGVELRADPVLIKFKRPREYYDAWLEAALLIGTDTYLLDRTVKATIAEVFPEACRRARHTGDFPEGIWYNPFGEILQKKINNRFQSYGITDECNSLAKLRDLIKSGMSGRKSPETETGQDFPQGRFYFNGDGTVYWFGSELTIQRKGNGGTQYIKVGGKSVNLIKTLAGMGVSRDTADRWIKNAESAYHRRQEVESARQQILEDSQALGDPDIKYA